jgi:hypothetical protein
MKRPKMPWTIAIEALEKKVENTFSDFKNYVDDRIEKRYEDAKKAINLVNRSEQFKHNDHKKRLNVLEEINREEVAAIIDRDLQAATNGAP